MWRSFLTVMVLSSLSSAQTAPEVNPGISPHAVDSILYHPSTTTTSPKASYQAYTRFTAVRRGKDEDVGIMLTIGGFVTAPNSAVAGIMPLKLEFDPLEGITINDVRGPKVWKSKFKFQDEEVKVTAAPYIHFKIHANQDAPLGIRDLKGRLTFQKVPTDGSAVGPVEQVDVQIPITVVESNAKVRKADFPYGPMPGWESFVSVASVSLLIVLIIPLLLLCTVTGTCPEC